MPTSWQPSRCSLPSAEVLAAAGLGGDTVGSRQIKDGQVKSIDVKDGGLLAKDFAPESISAIAARPVGTQPVEATYHEGSAIPLEDASWTQGPGEVNQIIGTFNLKNEAPLNNPQRCDFNTTAHLYFRLDNSENAPIGGGQANYDGEKIVITSDPIMYSGHKQSHTLLAWTNVPRPCMGWTVSDVKLAVLRYR